MSTPSLLTKISSSPRMSELMAWPLDFEIMEPSSADWFRLVPNVDLQAIAQDGTGGIFAFFGPGVGEERHVLFISSEGQAGCIASSLEEAIQLMIAYPYWRDCLKFSHGGELAEMLRVSKYLEQEIRVDEPGIDELRKELLEGLELANPNHALENLHLCVSSMPVSDQVVADDGSEVAGLFGVFTVEDNHTWR